MVSFPFLFFSFVLHDPLGDYEMVCKDPTAIPKSMGASPQHAQHMKLKYMYAKHVVKVINPLKVLK